MGNLDLGHGGAYAKVATAWLQWQLKNDSESAKLFRGDPPGLSKEEGWKFEIKEHPLTQCRRRRQKLARGTPSHNLTSPPMKRSSARGKDHLSKEKRSWNMSRIKSTNTRPEMIVRSLLHRMGYRFRLHVKDLPGKPDIVLPKYKTVIFVHGCFWHRHIGCKNCTTPTNRRDFWMAKLEGNAIRDRRHQRQLRKLGWRVAQVWESETMKAEALAISLGRALGRFPK